MFKNTEIAFSLKTDSELERAYFLFKMINNQPLVKIGTVATNFALKAKLPVEGLIRATVFDHFCGGVNEDDCKPVVDKLFTKKVSSVLDYSVEGKETNEQFESTANKTLDIISFCKEKESLPFAVFKPTGLGRFALFEKVSKKEKLTAEEDIEWQSVKVRFDNICSFAYNMNVPVLIDAEESWMQDAADELVLEMMMKYNKKRAVVFNTAQMYRWDRLEYLKSIFEMAKTENFYPGFKLVRGAYMEKENDRAKDLGYTSPICKSKIETDKNFNEALIFLLENLESCEIFIGSHNEESNLLAIDFMQKNHISNKDHRIWFGQLYGMSDHISFNLAHHDYQVAKYLPFGPVKDVMPYLIRRAEENTSVAGQTSRELMLIKAERNRRETK
jgi:proline dehydrogenase